MLPETVAAEMLQEEASDNLLNYKDGLSRTKDKFTQEGVTTLSQIAPDGKGHVEAEDQRFQSGPSSRSLRACRKNLGRVLRERLMPLRRDNIIRAEQERFKQRHTYQVARDKDQALKLQSDIAEGRSMADARADYVEDVMASDTLTALQKEERDQDFRQDCSQHGPDAQA